METSAPRFPITVSVAPDSICKLSYCFIRCQVILFSIQNVRWNSPSNRMLPHITKISPGKCFPKDVRISFCFCKSSSVTFRPLHHIFRINLSISTTGEIKYAFSILLSAKALYSKAPMLFRNHCYCFICSAWVIKQSGNSFSLPKVTVEGIVKTNYIIFFKERFL